MPNVSADHSPPPLVFINGQQSLQVSIFDRALQFGDGLFETILLQDYRCQFWPLHKRRLLDGCARLNFPIDSNRLEDYFQQLLAELAGIPALRYGSIKIIVSRGDSQRGYLPESGGECNYYCLAFSGEPLVEAPPPIRLGLSGIPLASQPLLAGLKHNNRLEQVLARQALSPEFAEALMLSGDGHVVEGISSNIFFKLDGCWRTPSLTVAGVAGTTRRLLLETLMPELGLACEQVCVPLTDFLGAEQVFICSSLRGVQAVGRFELSLTQSEQLSIKPADRLLEYAPEADIPALQQAYIKLVRSIDRTQ